MARTITDEDIKALSKVFATKDDLKSLENRLSAKFATKDDLKAFATKDEMNKRFDDLERILAGTFQEYEERMQRVETELGISVHN